MSFAPEPLCYEAAATPRALFRVYTSNNVGEAHNVVVTIGSTVGTTWTVTNKAGNTRVFSTASTYNGNLGGLSGADAICQARANTLGYGGIWKALLSDSISGAKDRLIINYPVVRATDGVTVSSTSLWTGSLLAPITPGGYGSWSGTSTDGSSFQGSNCNNWTNATASYSGRTGALANFSNSTWISNFYQGCQNDVYLACIEQPDPGCAVAPISFTNLTNATRSATHTSNTITPTGCATTSLAVVSGNGNAQIQVNSGPWVQSATINPGDSITLRQTTTAAYNTTMSARLTVGTTETIWTVTSESSGSATKIFTSINSYNGNLGGLAGADAICQIDAGLLGYAGTWKALLSDSTTNAKDRVSIQYPVIRASDNIVVAPTNLWGGSVQNAIQGPSGVWSGTDTAGNKYGTNWCDNWTNATSGYGAERVGSTVLTSSDWIVSPYTVPCSNASYRIYCVSQ